MEQENFFAASKDMRHVRIRMKWYRILDMIRKRIWKIRPDLYFARMELVLLFPGIRWKLICICKVVWIWMNWTVKAGMRMWKVRKIRVQRWITQTFPEISVGKNGKFSYSGSYEEEEELQAIFERTFGPMKRDRTAFQKKTVHSSTPATRYRAGKPRQEEYLLVDGYNIIFSWEELNELAKENIHAACDKLMDILSNYQGYRKCTLILVFDAYKVEGHAEEVIPYHNIYVVYTKEAETADQYIEKTVHRIGRQYQVTVATSDGLEQVIIMGQGAHRISARGLKKEIEDTEKTAREEWHQRRQSSKTYLFDHMSEEMQETNRKKSPSGKKINDLFI